MIINESNFKSEVLESKIPVLVDFWAEWCGPCRMLAPVIEELSKEFDGKVKVCKVNVDEAQKMASDYRIMSIPTIIIFKEGKEVARMVGVIPKADITAKLNAQL